MPYVRARSDREQQGRLIEELGMNSICVPAEVQQYSDPALGIALVNRPVTTGEQNFSNQGRVAKVGLAARDYSRNCNQ
jgi:hypothetical protein